MNHITQKTSKQAGYTAGAGAVAAMIVIIFFGDQSPERISIYTAGITVIINSGIKLVEKLVKRSS